MIAAVGVGLGAGHDRHAALQLDEQDIHAGGGFVAVRAVVDDAGNGSGVRRLSTASNSRAATA